MIRSLDPDNRRFQEATSAAPRDRYSSRVASRARRAARQGEGGHPSARRPRRRAAAAPDGPHREGLRVRRRAGTGATPRPVRRAPPADPLPLHVRPWGGRLARCGLRRCSMFVDHVGHLAHLHARDTSFVLVSRAPLEKIEPYRRRMGWSIPWYSSFESDFNVDQGVSPEEPQLDAYQDGESFGLSVFFRDGDRVYRTYFTSGRGVEALGSVWTFLDLTPQGRQEDWEDSPEGYPQTKPYE